MPRESCLHSAANADGCWYQRQRIVELLRNACKAGTMLRRKDTAISVLSVLQRTLDPNSCAHAKGVLITVFSFVIRDSRDLFVTCIVAHVQQQ